MPEHDLVDIRGGDPGIGKRLGRHPHDQALDGLTLETPEGGVCPANDASGHGHLLDSSLNVISRTWRRRATPTATVQLAEFWTFSTSITTALPGISVAILALFAFAFHPRWA